MQPSKPTFYLQYTMDDDDFDVEEIIAEPEEPSFSVPSEVWAVVAGFVIVCFIIYKLYSTRGTKAHSGRGK